MKKDSFLKGTIVASAAIIISKILGVLYVIPFYKIIGENGGVLYSYAYNIYNLFLNISTAGIPIALSMIISEYITLGKNDAKERTFKISKKIIITFSIISFLVLFIFSDYIAIFMTRNVKGTNPIKDISLVIKTISISLIITPYISVLRGYLQGHKFISPGSISQVWEQLIRIAVILIGSYLAIDVFKTSIPIGVSVALTGAFFGALGAYIYLRYHINKNKKLFESSDKKDNISDKDITKKIIYYCVPLIIISVTNDLYNIIDMKLIIKGLYIIKMPTKDAELIASMIATWCPKICMIVSAISIGLATSLMPHLISSYTKKDYKESNEIFNEATSTMLVLALPLTIGIALLSKEVYYIFYGQSIYGPDILVISIVVSLWLGILTVINTTLQGFKKFKLIIISTLIGLITNTILDIPLILILHKLNLKPYFGTSISTLIGATISSLIILIYLKKELNFSYKKVRKNTYLMIVPLIAMTIIVCLLNYLLPYKDNRLYSILKCSIIGIIGGVTYIFILYKSNGLNKIFGKDRVNKITKKLHIN